MAAFLKKACCNLTYSSISHIFKVRTLQRTTQYLSLKNYATDEPKNVQEILQELEENEAKMKYTEEEVVQMRDVSRLPKHLRDIMHKKMPDLTQTGLDSLFLKRKMYAKHGEASGISPKLLWPTKLEIKESMEDDAIIDIPLEVAVKKAFAKQEKDAFKRLKKEKEIDENLSKMRKLVSDYKLKIRKHRAVRRQTRKRKLLVESSAREVYGYSMTHVDPKFRSAVKQKKSSILKGYREFKAEVKARKDAKKKMLKEEKRKRWQEQKEKEAKEKTEVNDTS